MQVPSTEARALGVCMAGGGLPPGPDLPESVHGRGRGLMRSRVGDLCAAEHLQSYCCQCYCRYCLPVAYITASYDCWPVA